MAAKGYIFWDGKPLKRRISLAPYGYPDFTLDEFLHPDIYHRGMSLDQLIDLVINSGLPALMQFNRNYYQTSVFVNTWGWVGIGGRVDSGMRVPYSVGASLSYHKFFKAVDFVVFLAGKWLTGKELFHNIMDDPDMVCIMYEDFNVREIEYYIDKNGKMRNWCHLALLGSDDGEITVLRV